MDVLIENYECNFHLLKFLLSILSINYNPQNWKYDQKCFKYFTINIIEEIITIKVLNSLKKFYLKSLFT